MNWARGFLRLWAVLAVCWWTVATFHLLDDLSPWAYDEWIKFRPVELIETSSSEPTVDFSKFSDAQLEAYLNASKRAKFMVREVGIVATGWIVVSPFLLLLLGLAGVWVMRGFRRSGIQGGSP